MIEQDIFWRLEDYLDTHTPIYSVSCCFCGVESVAFESDWVLSLSVRFVSVVFANTRGLRALQGNIYNVIFAHCMNAK